MFEAKLTTQIIIRMIIKMHEMTNLSPLAGVEQVLALE